MTEQDFEQLSIRQAQDNPESIEGLKKELEECKKQADEYLNGWKRAKADYVNFKKETEESAKELKAWMSKIFIMPLLNIADSFDKAFLAVPENLKNDAWVAGVAGIKKQFEDYLKAQKVEAMPAVGETFDPLKHEAVESIEGGESGKIVEEVQKGYLMDGEVLRPARVKIFK